LLRLKPVRDLIDLPEEPRAILFVTLFGGALRLGESVIAVEPVDDLERAVDRIEVAVLKPVRSFRIICSSRAI